jgi:hypothetical protein
VFRCQYTVIKIGAAPQTRIIFKELVIPPESAIFCRRGANILLKAIDAVLATRDGRFHAENE